MISHYDVEFSEQNSSLQMANTSDNELLLTGLNPSGVYTVRVRANNYAKLDHSELDVISGLFTNITTVHLPDPLPGMLILLVSCRNICITLILSITIKG